MSGDDMQERIRQRLAQLKEEYAAGEKILAEREARQTELRQTLLRISGAIQVLEEELGDGAGPPAEPTGPAAAAGEEGGGT